MFEEDPIYESHPTMREENERISPTQTQEKRIFCDDIYSNEILSDLAKALETVTDQLNDEQYHTINQAFISTASRLIEVQEKNKSLQYKVHAYKLPANVFTDNEFDIYSNHIQKLEEHIQSLEKQVLFVKQTKKTKELTQLETIQSLVKQINGLNQLMVTTKEEKETIEQECFEKERTLQITLIHLSSAQEEIKRLLHQQNMLQQHKDQQEIQRMTEFLQQHSKYSSQQFMKLTSQLDAMRHALTKERSERTKEKIEFNTELTETHKKNTMLEQINDHLKQQIYDFSVVNGFHRMEEMSSLNQNRLNNSTPLRRSTESLRGNNSSTKKRGQTPIKKLGSSGVNTPMLETYPAASTTKKSSRATTPMSKRGSTPKKLTPSNQVMANFTSTSTSKKSMATSTSPQRSGLSPVRSIRGKIWDPNTQQRSSLSPSLRSARNHPSTWENHYSPSPTRDETKEMQRLLSPHSPIGPYTRDILNVSIEEQAFSPLKTKPTFVCDAEVQTKVSSMNSIARFSILPTLSRPEEPLKLSMESSVMPGYEPRSYITCLDGDGLVITPHKEVNTTSYSPHQRRAMRYSQVQSDIYNYYEDNQLRDNEETDEETKKFLQIIEQYNGLVDDYNALSSHAQGLDKETQSMKQDYKQEIQQSVNTIHDLTTKVSVLLQENDQLHEMISDQESQLLRYSITSLPSHEEEQSPSSMKKLSPEKRMLVEPTSSRIEPPPLPLPQPIPQPSYPELDGNFFANFFPMNNTSTRQPLDSNPVTDAKDTNTTSTTLNEDKNIPPNMNLLLEIFTKHKTMIHDLQSKKIIIHSTVFEEWLDILKQQYHEFAVEHEKSLQEIERLQAFIEIQTQQMNEQNDLLQNKQKEVNELQLINQKQSYENIKLQEQTHDVTHLEEALQASLQDIQRINKTLTSSSSMPMLSLDQEMMSNPIEHEFTQAVSQLLSSSEYRKDLQYIADLRMKIDAYSQELQNQQQRKLIQHQQMQQQQQQQSLQENMFTNLPSKSPLSTPRNNTTGIYAIQDNLPQSQYIPQTQETWELQEELKRTKLRLQLLSEQIQSMPSSLSVAQAEKRVLENKLQKATEAYEINIQRIQDHAIHKIHEIGAFLELEKQEKELLQCKLAEQRETIHQLTHHLKLLQSSSSSSAYKNIFSASNNNNYNTTSYSPPEVETYYDPELHNLSLRYSFPMSTSSSDLMNPTLLTPKQTTSSSSGAEINPEYISSSMKQSQQSYQSQQSLGKSLDFSLTRNNSSVNMNTIPSALKTSSSSHAVLSTPKTVKIDVPLPPWDVNAFPSSRSSRKQ